MRTSHKFLIVALILALLFVADLEAKKAKASKKEKEEKPEVSEKPAKGASKKVDKDDDDSDLDDDDDDLDLDDDDDDDLDDDDDDDNDDKEDKESKTETKDEEVKSDEKDSEPVAAKKESKKSKKKAKAATAASASSSASSSASEATESAPASEKTASDGKKQDDEKDDDADDDDLDDDEEDDDDDDDDDLEDDDDDEEGDDEKEDDDEEEGEVSAGHEHESNIPPESIAKFNRDGNAILSELDYANFPYDFQEHFATVEKKVLEVETVNGSLPAKTLLEHANKGQAFIVKGETDVARWNASKEWSSDAYLVGKVGKKQITVEMQKDGKIFGADSERLNVSVSRFFEIAHNEGSYSYFAVDIPLREQLKELKKDWKTPSALAGEGSAAFAFFGAGGEVIPLHVEVEHNLYTVVEGKKKFVLYPPSDLKHLYPYQPHPEGAWSISSLTSHASIDKKKLPQFSRATRIEIIVEAGEMLFIPALWWHEVTNIGKTKAISFLFVNDYASHTQKEADAFSSFLTTRATRRFASDASSKKSPRDEL